MDTTSSSTRLVFFDNYTGLTNAQLLNFQISGITNANNLFVISFNGIVYYLSTLLLGGENKFVIYQRTDAASQGLWSSTIENKSIYYTVSISDGANTFTSLQSLTNRAGIRLTPTFGNATIATTFQPRLRETTATFTTFGGSTTPPHSKTRTNRKQFKKTRKNNK
jgi:hypothetical protein